MTQKRIIRGDRSGAELAAYTVPERLKWPRGTEANVVESDEGERRGATLFLRVDPARALDVEYRARQIMDRINAYFGYRAIEIIRLIQAPLHLPPCGGGREGGNPNGRRSGIPPPLTPPHKGEENGDPLVAALARLERGILGDSPRRRA